MATILRRTSRLQRRLPDKKPCHIGEWFITDVAELKKRKEALNLAIVYVDPDAFIANFVGWLEITAFITAQRAGLARMPDNGITPALSEEQLKRAGVQNVGIEDNLPALRETLEDTGNDQPSSRTRF